MYTVHKYMALDPYEVGYFIEQVGLAATSFGVSKLDVTWVAATLEGFFGTKCAAKTMVVPETQPELQSICIAVSNIASNAAILMGLTFPEGQLSRRSECDVQSVPESDAAGHERYWDGVSSL